MELECGVTLSKNVRELLSITSVELCERKKTRKKRILSD